MKDFLFNNYSLLTHSVEAMAAITGLFLFSRYKNTAVKYFIYFLVYLTICDTVNEYTLLIYPEGILEFLANTKISRNYWWSTLFWKIGAILFFAFFYRKILERQLFKSIIKYAVYPFLIVSITYILFYWEDFFNRYFPVISVLGTIIIFTCTIFYFIEVLQTDKILTFYKSVYFYISAAIFIWWLIITPIVFYDIYMTNIDMNYISLRRLIYLLANIIMYSTFTFALIFCKPQNKVVNA
ncbi:hypothetical protein J1D01_13435 [Seonamhaeicola sp. NFXS20]|uniref:hypothetical protein n=1 Tax=Seonamhaeicola sp. NFXS20 TaxID=2816959 RepID=UPI003B8DE46C